MTPLSPSAEERIAAVFEDGLLATAKAIAGLIRVDVKTLRAMTDEGVIRAVRRGKRRAYTEADVRAYLATPAPAREKKPCPSTSRRTARTSTMTSSGKVVAFTALQASRREGRPKR